MGRTLQRRYGQESQVVITLPSLEGTDGVRKMSKSLGNYIGIKEAPEEIFGKAISIDASMRLARGQTCRIRVGKRRLARITL